MGKLVGLGLLLFTDLVSISGGDYPQPAAFEIAIGQVTRKSYLAFGVYATDSQPPIQARSQYFVSGNEKLLSSSSPGHTRVSQPAKEDFQASRTNGLIGTLCSLLLPTWSDSPQVFRRVVLKRLVRLFQCAAHLRGGCVPLSAIRLAGPHDDGIQPDEIVAGRSVNESR